MNKLKFVLLSLCILLTGALAAGFAARAVVSPQVGETFSAGVLNVPSVLGQTAEEVLFHPWSLYETEPLISVAEYYQRLLAEEAGYDADPTIDAPATGVNPTDAPAASAGPIAGTQQYEQFSAEFVAAREQFSAHYLVPFEMLDAVVDEQAAFDNLLCNGNGTRVRSLLFLKDLPARSPEGVPLSLSFAYSDSSPTAITYLVRPGEPQSPTEAEQAAALERVKADLLALLTDPGRLTNPVLLDQPDNDAGMLALLGEYFGFAETNGLYFWPGQTLLHYLLFYKDYFNESPEPSTLDQLLVNLENYGVSLQLISTPEQIVVLFTLETDAMVGVYYDIQLGRYSGFGFSFSS